MKRIPETDQVDKAGMDALFVKKKKEPIIHHPEHSAVKPSGFSKQTNFLIALGVIALGFIVLFGIKIFNQPEIITPDELHAKNLAGKLPPEEGYLYEGFSFVWYEGVWFTQMHKPGTDNLYNIQLHFGPRDLGNVSLGEMVENFGELPSTYITFDPTRAESSPTGTGNFAYIALAAGELSLNLAVVLNTTPVAACTKNETMGCASRPIVNCDKDASHAIISLRQAEQPAVLLEDNCLIIEGKDRDLVRATDRALLLWMGIMKREII